MREHWCPVVPVLWLLISITRTQEACFQSSSSSSIVVSALFVVPPATTATISRSRPPASAVTGCATAITDPIGISGKWATSSSMTSWIQLLAGKRSTTFSSSLLLSSSSSSTSSTSSASSSTLLSSKEERVYDFMKQISDSMYGFRVIVVGSGTSAILETTHKPLGPIFKLNQSPIDGTNLLTIASDDQSFEFHIKLQQVANIAISLKEKGDKTLRIIRLSNDEQVAICTLILVDTSDAAINWYKALIEQHGDNIQLL